MSEINITIAGESHISFVTEILKQMASAAKIRGTGIARRSPDYIKSKMLEKKAIIALDDDKFVGFCYVESWEHNKFAANSGLIVAEEYRGKGIARKIKSAAFNLSVKLFPEAKLFGLTTGLAVMKINSELGYRPVTLSELTDDNEFWKGCQSCVNYDILIRTGRKHCLCTGMLFDPAKKTGNELSTIKNKKYKHRRRLGKSLRLYERWMRLKLFIMLKPNLGSIS